MEPNIDFTKIVTPAEFLRAELEMGISMQNEAFVELTRRTAGQLDGLDIKTVLDYGAGTGVYAEAYRRMGYDVLVYEIWDDHKNYIRENAPLLKIISQPVTTDLMNFIEVAEHMTDDELNALFARIQPTFILFSSTSERTEWDAAWGHINVKAQDEWVRLFYDLGYEYVKPMSYPTGYTKLFKRR